jgi:diguanylate cyclase (GGDEF)-like protein
MLDLEGLETAIDRLGQASGDDALREVASVISQSVRLVDTVARWGGDEFMLVAPGATGTTVVRRIVEAIASTTMPAGGHITVSAGLAHYPADGTVSDELVFAAKAALRAAQAAGPGTLAEAAHPAGNGATPAA